MPVRVYDLSKELGISNKELIERLKTVGLEVKSQSSTIPTIYADEIRKQFGVVAPPAAPKFTKSCKTESSPATAPPPPPVEQVPPPPLTTVIPEPTPSTVEPPPPAVKPVEAPPVIAPPLLKPSAPLEKTEAPAKPTAPAPPPPFIPPRPSISVAPPAIPAKTVTPPASPKVAPPPPPPAPPVVVVKAGETLRMKPPVVVKDLAARLGLKPYQLISELIEMNVFATISQTLDEAAAKKACARHGVNFELEKRDHHWIRTQVQERVVLPEGDKPERKEDLKLRPPVVTFMGHVDHGKTSLLDAIRKANVAAKEAGGITQHVGAYTVEVPNPRDKKEMRRITFLDTPGHEAFTAMRARGANLTDIVVLVVAADDGVMPQTVEALNHARAAKVPIIVAINKIDLPTASPERVKRQLQEHDLTPEEWGGETIVAEVSATTRKGLDNLLELILLQAEILELKANPKCAAAGNVIESQMEPSGPTVTVLVRKGTLKVGDAVLCDRFHGKVKALTDYQGKRTKEAGPSESVKILGLNGLPQPGQEFVVTKKLDEARALAAERAEKEVTAVKTPPRRATLEDLFKQMADNQRKELRLILKADVQGSLEAIAESLKKIKSEKVSLDVIHKAIGPITENDVLLASASDAVIVGFQVRVESGVSEKAKHEGVQIKLYSIIYELLDQVEKAMEGLLEPEIRETVLGHADIKQVFEISKGKVAGCVVRDGRVPRNARARLLRRGQVQIETRIASLKRFQDDATEVRAGQDCGIRLENFTDYQPGDVIECYQVEKIAQKL